MTIDYDYLASSLASLSGLPVRLYKDHNFIKIYHHTKFKPDLAILEEDRIFKNEDSISYYIDENLLIYGLINNKGDGYSLLVGPVSPVSLDNSSITKILRKIGEPLTRSTELFNYFSLIPSYPLRNFLQILCTINYFLNDEKLDVSTLILGDIEFQITNKEEENKSNNISIHNTMDLERTMLNFVRFGESKKLEELFKNPIEGRVGNISPDAIRREKNLIICTVTLVTRAAIDGGLDIETAFNLSDLYIQKAELLNDYLALTRLNAEMVMDFTKHVEKIKYGNTKLSLKIRSYVLSHLNENISIDELSKYLGKNRTYLCKLFKEETGMTISRYILMIKMEEAKMLLKDNRKTLSEISFILGFSSQSHFQNTFKKYTGLTPKDFRSKE